MGQRELPFSDGLVRCVDVIISTILCVAALLPVAIDFEVVNKPGSKSRNETLTNTVLYNESVDFQVTFWATVITVDLAVCLTVWAVIKLLKGLNLYGGPKPAFSTIISWILSNFLFVALLVMTKMSVVNYWKLIYTLVLRAIFCYFVLQFCRQFEQTCCSF